jgi:hypothetical protein
MAHGTGGRPIYASEKEWEETQMQPEAAKEFSLNSLPERRSLPLLAGT